MIVTICPGYHDLDGVGVDCGMVLNKKDNGTKYVEVSHRFCSKCRREIDDIAEVFFNQEGSTNNIF